MPLWLESYAAAMLASVPIGTVVLQIVQLREASEFVAKYHRHSLPTVRYIRSKMWQRCVRRSSKAAVIRSP
jgi:hypothetical protein